MSKVDFGGPVVDNLGAGDGGGVDSSEPIVIAPEENVDGLDHSRPCAKVNSKGKSVCDSFLPNGAPNSQKYCVRHQPKKKSRTLGEPAEKRPPKIEVKLAPPAKATPDELAVEEGARQLLNMIPLVMAMSGDEVCPPAITEAIPAIAKQLGALTKYHPGLKKIFAPGESTGEAIAWLSLLLATTPVLLIVAGHHHLLPESMLERLTGVIVVAAGINGD